MIIGVDFDGTCVKHEFPAIGEEVPGAVEVMKNLVASGHQIILWTMRSNNGVHPGVLNDAVRWFREREIPLYGVNINPTQSAWTNSPKAYCHFYIDDAALGCPLMYPLKGRPYVDWWTIEKIFKDAGHLHEAADT